MPEIIKVQYASSRLSELAEYAGEGSVLLLVAARLVDKEAGNPVLMTKDDSEASGGRP